MQVFKEAVQLSKGQKPAERDGVSVSAAVATVRAAPDSDLVVNARRLRLLVTNGVLAVAEADGFGSFEFADLPANPIALLAVELNLVLTKDGVGYLAASDLDVAVGTAAASNATLATTMLNVINKADFDASAIAPVVALHSASNSSPAPLVLPTGAKSLFLNVAGATETGEDASLSVSGTIDLTWMDLG